jgi:hypothetical protein
MKKEKEPRKKGRLRYANVIVHILLYLHSVHVININKDSMKVLKSGNRREGERVMKKLRMMRDSCFWEKMNRYW